MVAAEFTLHRGFVERNGFQKRKHHEILSRVEQDSDRVISRAGFEVGARQ